MNDDQKYDIIIENRLISFISLLHEGGVQGDEYKDRLNKYINILCDDLRLNREKLIKRYNMKYATQRNKSSIA